jgi:hypothetical protein
VFIPHCGMKKANQCTFCGCDYKILRTNTVNNAGAVPAFNWNMNNKQFNADRNNADNQNTNNGVRGGMRDYVLWVAFSQPPNILPISAIFICVWKILVSFASLNSKNNLSLIAVISSWLLALIKYTAFKDLGAFLAIIKCSMQAIIEFSILTPSV